MAIVGLAIVGLAFVIRWIGVPLHLAEHHHHLSSGLGMQAECHGAHGHGCFGHGKLDCGAVKDGAHEDGALDEGEHGHGAQRSEPGDRKSEIPGHTIEDHLEGLAEATPPRAHGLDVLAPVTEVAWSHLGHRLLRSEAGERADGPRPPPPRDSGPPRAPPIVT